MTDGFWCNYYFLFKVIKIIIFIRLMIQDILRTKDMVLKMVALYLKGALNSRRLVILENP